MKFEKNLVKIMQNLKQKFLGLHVRDTYISDQYIIHSYLVVTTYEYGYGMAYAWNLFLFLIRTTAELQQCAQFSKNSRIYNNVKRRSSIE